MKKVTLAVSGTMDISTDKDMNIICGLLETLSELRVTPPIDSFMWYESKTFMVFYREEYRHEA